MWCWFLSYLQDFALAQAMRNALQRRWAISENSPSEATVGNLIDAIAGPLTWPNERGVGGLEAMTEANSDFFSQHFEAGGLWTASHWHGRWRAISAQKFWLQSSALSCRARHH